jgi:hypothetical protein
MEWQISTAIAVIEKVFKGISGLLLHRLEERKER